MEIVYRCEGAPAAIRLVSADGSRIDAAVWTDEAPAGVPAGILAEAVAWIDAYFSGAELPPVPPLADEGTEWQRRVWRAIDAIPPGATVTYGELARELGCPGAARAVGMAAGRNRVMLFRPCHRVVGAGGALTGYAGGVERKRALLAHERSISSEGWKAL